MRRAGAEEGGEAAARPAASSASRAALTAAGVAPSGRQLTGTTIPANGATSRISAFRIARIAACAFIAASKSSAWTARRFAALILASSTPRCLSSDSTFFKRFANSYSSFLIARAFATRSCRRSVAQSPSRNVSTVMSTRARPAALGDAGPTPGAKGRPIALIATTPIWPYVFSPLMCGAWKSKRSCETAMLDAGRFTVRSSRVLKCERTLESSVKNPTRIQGVGERNASPPVPLRSAPSRTKISTRREMWLWCDMSCRCVTLDGAHASVSSCGYTAGGERADIQPRD